MLQISNHAERQENIKISAPQLINSNVQTVYFGLFDNLFEAMINEGLACHFTIEVCKTDTPYYCQVLDEELFATLKV